MRHKRTPPISETSEHKAIADYFAYIGLGGNAIAFHVRNERAGDWQRIMARKMGVLAGVPDWVIIDGGRAGFIELKPRGWKASTAKLTHHELRQIEAQNRLKRAGAWVSVCETLDEVLATLAAHGVPLRTEAAVISGLRASLAAEAK